MTTNYTWQTQVPLNVQKLRAAKQHVKANQKHISLIGLNGSGELSAAALQYGDY